MSFEQPDLKNDNWYTSNDNLKSGPYRFSELVDAANNKILTPTDLVWHGSWAAWRPASSIPGLFSASNDEASPSRPNIIAPAIAVEAPRKIVPPRPAVAVDGSATSARKRGYFSRHWHGDLSLAVSYWVNGLLCFVAASIIVGIFSVATESLKGASGTPILVAMVFMLAPIFTLTVWQIVGIWRSASRHVGRGGKPVWANLAKIAVILSVVRLIAEIALNFVPLASEHFQIALGDTKFGESRFQLLRDGRELEFSGGINIGAAKKLDEILNVTPEITVLHLNSHGGRVLEADLMAKIVQQRKLITYVHTSCESACTNVFLAASERWIGQQAKLGFHRPSSGLRGDDSQDAVKDERALLSSKNLPKDFIEKALQTPPESMWYPAHNELLAARAISGIADPGKFAVSGPSTSINTDRMSAVLMTIPTYVALKQYEPATYDDVVQTLTKGFQSGLTQPEIAARGRVIIGKIVGRKLSYAADDLVLEFADIYITYMRGLGKTDTANCVALFDGTKGVPMVADLNSLFPEASAKELALHARILQLKTTGAARETDAQQVDAVLSEVFGKLAQQPDVKLDVLEKEKLLPSEHAAYCHAATAFLTETRRMPPNKAAIVFRHIYALAGT